MNDVSASSAACASGAQPTTELLTSAPTSKRVSRTMTLAPLVLHAACQATTSPSLRRSKRTKASPSRKTLPTSALPWSRSAPVVDVDGRSVLPVVGVVDVVLVLVERARALAEATEVEVEVAVAVVALPQPGTATARPATTSIWATRT